MTEQACELGIPSFQLEIPLKMRKQIFESDELCKGLLNVIVDVYLNVVVPWWPVRQIPLRVNPQLGATNLKTLTAPNSE